jgi:hypothetical protein
MRKRRKKSWEIMQRHHMVYAGPEIKEVVVKVTRTEHFFLGHLDSYGKAHGFNPGFCRNLKYLIKQHGRSKNGSRTENIYRQPE